MRGPLDRPIFIDNMPTLDTSLLDSFASPGVFTRIDPLVQAKLTPLPEVRDRVAGCTEFCYLVHSGRLGASTDVRELPDAAELECRRRYLRAALAEFASMDDAAVIDFASLGRPSPPRMRTSSDPRIHVVRLLRHANIHLSATELKSLTRIAVWDGPIGRQEFEYLLIQAVNLPTSIRATDGAQQYTRADMDAMLHWLEDEQREWGIDHVVLRCAELYAAIVAAAV